MHTATAIYATFVLTVVAEEDKSRPIWPSCPALGWTKGVDRLTVRPNGNALETPVGELLLQLLDTTDSITLCGLINLWIYSSFVYVWDR